MSQTSDQAMVILTFASVIFERLSGIWKMTNDDLITYQRLTF